MNPFSAWHPGLSYTALALILALFTFSAFFFAPSNKTTDTILASLLLYSCSSHPGSCCSFFFFFFSSAHGFPAHPLKPSRNVISSEKSFPSPSYLRTNPPLCFCCPLHRLLLRAFITVNHFLLLVSSTVPDT